MSDVKRRRSQREIIEADPSARLHVSAGPGTGKTAVACARAAWLVDKGNPAASDIWLISFTRTAVSEIRGRIATCMKDDADAFTVKIATLDSHAWTIHSGFDEGAKILGSYEENIKGALCLVRSNAGVSEYLERLEHLIVDEAQDIVGIRSEGVDLFLPNSLFLLPDFTVKRRPALRSRLQSPCQAVRPTRARTFRPHAPARPFHALVDQDLVGGRRRSAQPLRLA